MEVNKNKVELFFDKDLTDGKKKELVKYIEEEREITVYGEGGEKGLEEIIVWLVEELSKRVDVFLYGTGKSILGKCKEGTVSFYKDTVIYDESQESGVIKEDWKINVRGNMVCVHYIYGKSGEGKTEFVPKVENKFNNTLTEEQKSKIKNHIEIGSSMLIVGKAGTGKTELIAWVMENNGGNAGVCVVDSYGGVRNRYEDVIFNKEPIWLEQGEGYKRTEGLHTELYNWLMYDEIRGTTNLEEIEEQIAEGVNVVATLTTSSTPEHIEKWFNYLSSSDGVGSIYDVALGLDKNENGEVTVKIYELKKLEEFR